MDATKNLTVPRGAKSVWDKPSLSSSLLTCDQERWLMAATGSVLAMAGARRGGFTGGLVAMAGSFLAVRAAMGRHDFNVARRWVESAMNDRWGAIDKVEDAALESFPASDAPAWTAVSGSAPGR
jgi:uncharacterized membrane protein